MIFIRLSNNCSPLQGDQFDYLIMFIGSCNTIKQETQQNETAFQQELQQNETAFQQQSQQNETPFQHELIKLFLLSLFQSLPCSLRLRAGDCLAQHWNLQLGEGP